jgi:G3E family GTPase
MKISIEVVTGFLGSGKTSFINSLLSESQVEGEKILIFQLEQGRKNIQELNNKSSSVKVKNIAEVKNLKEEMIYSIKEYNPNRIILEYNGTSNLNDLFDVLKQNIYKECSKVTTIYFVADGKNLINYIDNLGSFMVPFIQYANMIVVNNIDYCSKELVEDGLKKLKNINPKAFILKINNKYRLRPILRDAKVLDNGYLKKLKIRIANYNR